MFQDNSGSMAEWLSGGASFLAAIVALGGYWWAHLQRRDDYKRSDVAIAHAVQNKLKNCINYTEDWRRSVTNSIVVISQGCEIGDQIWYKVKPPPFVPEDIGLNLNDAEVDFLMRMEEYDLLEEMELAFRKYHLATAILKQYAIMRDELLGDVPRPYLDGERVILELSKKERDHFRLKGGALDELILNAKQLFDENVEAGERLKHSLSASFDCCFPGHVFPKLVKAEDRTRNPRT